MYICPQFCTRATRFLRSPNARLAPICRTQQCWPSPKLDYIATAYHGIPLLIGIIRDQAYFDQQVASHFNGGRVRYDARLGWLSATRHTAAHAPCCIRLASISRLD
jgi:hypothetical protein